jgi:hypothetical protein
MSGRLGSRVTGHNPRRAEPGSNGCEHQTGQGRVFNGKKLRYTRQFHQLIGIEIGQSVIAQKVFKESFDQDPENDNRNG